MKVFKKNQILLVLLAICLMVVGYVNFRENGGESIGNSEIGDYNSISMIIRNKLILIKQIELHY